VNHPALVVVLQERVTGATSEPPLCSPPGRLNAMTDDRYYIKIVPHRGDTIHRFVVRRSHVAAAVILLLAVIGAGVGFALGQVAHARHERSVLARIAGQTAALQRQLQRLAHENAQITNMIGAPAVHRAKPATPAAHAKRVSMTGTATNIGSVERRVALLTVASARLAREAASEQQLVMRILNLRHIRAITRERLMAFIPSIDPVVGATIDGCFCWRSYPDREFHEGVDLAAGYGDPVRAAAAGTVTQAGWDGGYGIKVVVDHGNGYQTWYAHLSRVDVSAGERVYKGETIGLVGATGFATGPHLHYQVMLDGRAVDPSPYLDGIPSSVVAALP
jgi:murein DD-endopeptidase MepM/ murein hydrolase activator NlpD